MSEKKMKPEVKAKWLEALRSGEFEQGSGELCGNDGTYCCLGVLSELAVQEGVADKWQDHDDWAYTFGKRSGGRSAEFLPTSVRKWAGLDSDNPSVLTKDGMRSLADLNDHGRTFTDIADLIENQL